jgi:hypothetical protein
MSRSSSLFLMLPLTACMSACAAGVTFPPNESTDASPVVPRSDTGPTTPAALPTLGLASTYVVLAGSSITNIGASDFEGDIGVSPGDAVSGLPSGTVPSASVAAFKAQSDLAIAYDSLTPRACDLDLSEKSLTDLTLKPGTYCVTGPLQLSGTLTLDAQSDPAAAFVFKITGTFGLDDDAIVKMTNGGKACSVFWQVGGAALIGQGAELVGNVLATADISIGHTTSLSGRALTRYGAITLDENLLAVCPM